MKKYNFNAGPSMLPREVIEATADACLDFEGSGLSLMEISHRAKNFQPVVDKAVELVNTIIFAHIYRTVIRLFFWQEVPVRNSVVFPIIFWRRRQLI